MADLGFLFKLIHDSFEKDLNHLLKSQELTMSQMQVLGFLFAHSEEAVTHRDIEKFLDLSHPTVVGILKRMESKGFIRTAVNKKDRRCRDVFLAEKAASVRKAMEAHKAHMESKLTAGMTEAQVKELDLLLHTVLKNMDQ